MRAFFMYSGLFLAAAMFLAIDPKPAAADQCVNGADWFQVSYVASNYPDRYIRHSNYVGVLSDPAHPFPKPEVELADATFDLMSGFDCRPGIPGYVLRSRNFPNRFFRHRNFEVYLDEAPMTGDQKLWALFNKDATFEVIPGLAGKCSTFRSTNFPDRYIRHRNFRLYLDQADGSDMFKKDATFCQTPPRAGYYPTTHVSAGSSDNPPFIQATVNYDPTNLSPVLRMSGSSFTPNSAVTLSATVVSTDGVGTKTSSSVDYGQVNVDSSGRFVKEQAANCPSGMSTTFSVIGVDSRKGAAHSGAGC